MPTQRPRPAALDGRRADARRRKARPRDLRFPNANTPTPEPPVDSTGDNGDDGRMEARLSKLETDVAAVKIDVTVIKANGATKSDVAELKGMFAELRASTKADSADAKTAIILWVVGAIFIAQLLPSIVKMFV